MESKLDRIWSVCLHSTGDGSWSQIYQVWSYLKNVDERLNGRSCWMFVDKNTGEVYKPASYKAPAKGVRYLITQLADNPHICDAYGSFLYL